MGLQRPGGAGVPSSLEVRPGSWGAPAEAPSSFAGLGGSRAEHKGPGLALRVQDRRCSPSPQGTTELPEMEGPCLRHRGATWGCGCRFPAWVLSLCPAARAGAVLRAGPRCLSTLLLPQSASKHVGLTDQVRGCAQGYGVKQCQSWARPFP